MKVLLFGDFSACHLNLQHGLQELGHNVTLCSGKDGYKGLTQDICIDSKLKGPFAKIHNQIKPYFVIEKLTNYDVCQAINPFFPSGQLLNRPYIYNKLIKNNEKFFLLAAGTDAFYCRFASREMDYSPLDDFYRYDVRRNQIRNGLFYMRTEQSYSFNKDLALRSCAVIPVIYDYYCCYKSLPNVKKVIPLPIAVAEVPYVGLGNEKKIHLFHGLSRYGFKGTRHIEKAFHFLSRRYPSDIDVTIAGKMPLAQYLELLRSSDVVVDQVSSYSSGMNALYAMAMGKIVMGGAENAARISEGSYSSPVINLKPDFRHIIAEVEKLLDQRQDLERLSVTARQYVESRHDSVKVARQYVDIWSGSEPGL